MIVKINYKKLLISIGVPLILGALVGLLSGSASGYKEMITPSFAPPGWIFPVVWSILYILMGVSDYLIKEELSINKSIKEYNYQLVINLLWSFIFFTFKWYLISFIWILVLIWFVYKMIREFYNINKISSYIQVPYLIWIVFASILNFSIYLLN